MSGNVKLFTGSFCGLSASIHATSLHQSPNGAPHNPGQSTSHQDENSSFGRISGQGFATGKCERHREYYFEDGNIVILVENTLYKLHRSMLDRHSAVFHEMWSVPQPPGTTEGMTDDNPIILDGISAVDFTRFLWVLYPSVLGTCKATTAEEWISILDQADRWQIDSLRFCAVAQLKNIAMAPIPKIVLWTRYNLDANDLISSYASLIMRQQSLTLEEAQALGMEEVVKVAHARDRAHGEGLSKCRTGHIWNGVNCSAVLPQMESQILKIVKDIFGIPSTNFWL